MHALIDGDIFLYEFGSAKKEDGSPLPWPFVVSRMDARIYNILDAVGADTHQIYLTGKGNFREQVATIKPYKGHRPADKPYWHSHLFDFLVYHRDAIVVEGMEADDAVGIAQMTPNKADTWRTVICSRDKDLHMIPGWHYTWGAGKQKEQPLWWQNETDALRCFYKQLLTGDSVDNIPGLYGVGKSSKLLARIDELDSELEMFRHVAEQYKLRFGSYWDQFMTENGLLLWIKRTGESEDEDVFGVRYELEYLDRFDKLAEEMSRTQTEEGEGVV